MTTTVRIAQRLAQKMFAQDFARLSMTQSEDLRDAMNKGISEFVGLLPSSRRIRSCSFLVESPQSLSVNVIAGSSSLVVNTALPVASYSAAAALVGRGLVIDGVALVNRLLSATQLIDPWLGNTGTVDATVYADGIPLDLRTDQIAGDVCWLPDTGGNARHLGFCSEPLTDNRHISPSQIGTPTMWWMENFGGGDAQEVRLVLRLWPLPSVRGLIRMPVAQFPAAVSLEDLHVTPRSLPVDDLEQGYLTSLCAVNLFTARGLANDLDKPALERDAEKARTELGKRANPNPSGQRNSVGTPKGF